MSADDGYTWHAEVTRFASGTHPDIAASPSGLILRAAYVAGALSITRQYPGDASPGSAFNAKNASEVDLGLTDDSSRMVCAASGFWWLHVRLGAGASTSLLFSADDGATWASTSGAVTGITGGTRPHLCVGADGTLTATARVGTALHLTRRHPGDPSWSTPAAVHDDAGADLSVADQASSCAVAFEGARRLLWAGILTGGTMAQDRFSSDDGISSRVFS